MLFSQPRRCAFLLTVISLLTLPFFCHGSQDEIIELPMQLSPALYQIAEDFSLVKTAQIGNEIQFEADDFEELLGVKKVSEVMITSLPPITVGTLKLGNSTVLKNQVITRSRLDELTFIPESNTACEASFTFRAVGSEEYELTCQLYLLEGVNYRPSVEMVAENRTDITTYENIATFRRMSASDPENDPLQFEIVEYPKKGILTVTNRALGEYTYTPISDFVGKDSFTYMVYDSYGNRSDEISVQIKVEENDAAVVYSDLIGQRAQYPALRLTAEGITSVRYENGSAVFAPDETVTRLDFLVMAMQAAGYRVSTTASSTTFLDDEMIPNHAKGYVSAAVNMGFINGVETENGICFFPVSPISRAECAVILSRMIQPSQPVVRPVFSDSDSIPAYAVDAIHALNHIGILECIGTSISPSASLTRAQSAEILCALMDHLEITQ